MAKNDCPTKLLEDSPTKKDKFGSHKRVADSIAGIINSEDEGGKSIALTGTWGSGKSSIIRILEDKLDSNVELFSYNTWSHEGDPLRRSFLEKLIDFFINHDWVSKKDRKEHWSEEKDKLAKKIKDKTVKKTPYLTPIGKIFAILTLLVPVGASITANLITSLNEFQNWQLVGASFLATGPVLFVLLLYLFAKLNLIEKDFRFLAQQSSEYIESKTLESPEPTSIEFQKIFSDLLKEGICGSDRELVIVMDNIDRINPKEALEVWSSMRTFLDFSSDEDWVDQVWLLVPFDEDSIKEMWGKRGDKQGSPENEDSLGNAFLEKTFQVKFHVPKPLLSNWKEFFLENLNKAFPKHHQDKLEEEISPDAFEDVYKIFSVKRKHPNRQPTPREIKLYINEIGSLHRQWKHEIPLKHMALYISLKETEEEFEQKLANPRQFEMSNQIMGILDENWKDDLAALHLNKPPEEAMEFLLIPRIENAVSQKEKETMDKLMANQGFPEVLRKYIDNKLSSNEYEKSFVLVLAKLIDGTQDKTEKVWRDIWDQLSQFISQVKQWEMVNPETGEGIVSIMEYESDRGILDQNIGDIAAALSKIGEKQKSDETIGEEEIKNWFNGIVPIIEYIPDKQESTFGENFHVPGSFESFIQACSLLQDSNLTPDANKYFKPDLDLEKIVSQLGQRCNQGNYDQKCLSVVKVLGSFKTEIEWSPLVKEIKNYLQDQNQNITDQESEAFVRTLFEIGENDEIGTDTLENLSTNGRFAHHLSRSFKNDTAGAGSLIFAILSSQPNLNNLTNWNQANQGRKFIRDKVFRNPGKYTLVIDTFIDLMSSYSYSSFENLVRIVKEENKAQPFFVETIRTLLNKKVSILQEIFKEPMDFEILLEEFPFVEEVFSEDPKILEQFITQLEDELVLSSEITSFDFNPNSGTLYSRLLREHCTEKFINFIRTQINQVSSGTWGKQLQKDGSLIDLLIAFKEAKGSINLNNLSNALSDYSEKIIEDDIEPKEKVSSNFQLILSFLPGSSKINLLEKVRNMIIQTKKGPNKDVGIVVEMYQPDIYAWDRWEGEIDDTIRFVFDKIADSDNEKEIEWMEEFIEKNSDKIHPEDVDSLSDFVQKLDDLKDEDHPHLQNVYEHLAEKVNNQNKEEGEK